MVKPRAGWLCLLVSTAPTGCGPAAPPAAAPSGHAPAPVTPARPALAFDDGGVCPAGPRSAVDACLAEHAFCARDVTPLAPALPDLVVVVTHGAVDCAGYYLLAAAGGQWKPLREVHRYAHHDPVYDRLRVVSMRDETVAGHRVTRLAFAIELVPSETDGSPGASPSGPEPEHRALSCTWPAAGFPSCE
jgi:hypothetical protein